MDPPLPEYTRNYLIIRLLPTRIQDSLATVDFANTSKVIKTLSWLDGTERTTEKIRAKYRGNKENQRDRYDTKTEDRDRNKEENNGGSSRVETIGTGKIGQVSARVEIGKIIENFMNKGIGKQKEKIITERIGEKKVGKIRTEEVMRI